MSAVHGDYYGTTCDFSAMTTTWSANGNTVTMTSSGDTTEYVVTAMTATTMTVQDIYSYEGANYIEEYTFTKQL